MNISKIKSDILNIVSDSKKRKKIIYGACFLGLILFAMVVSEVSQLVGVTNPDASVIKDEYESLNDVNDENGKKIS